MVKAIICGGRDYESPHRYPYQELVELVRIHKITKIIEGGARGADRLGREFAIDMDITFQTVKADWDKHGKYRAGPIRNQKMLDMLDDDDIVIAFPGGSGTRDMKNRAWGENIKVVEIG